MRLNSSMKSAFVRAVLDDVPRVDYYEQLKKIIKEDQRKALPPQVVTLMDDPKLREYLYHTSIGFNLGESTGSFGGYVSFNCVVNYKPSPAAQKTIDELLVASRAQGDTRRELRAKLTAAIDACSTRKQAVASMPELEKYLPKEDAPAKNLPAVANLVTDLVKLGWPDGGKKKDKQKEAVAA